MKPRSSFAVAAVCLLIGACAAPHDAHQRASQESSHTKPVVSKTPDWVKKIPDRMAEILVERHLCKTGPVWGLARRDPTGKLYGDLEYEEIGSAGYCHIAAKYNLWDKMPPLTDQEKQKALQFWQSWQDPESGVFKDP